MRTQPSTVARTPGFWWVVAATVIGLVLWVQRLTANPLFVDEGASWWVASQDSVGSFWDLLVQQEVAPPPFYIGLRVVVDALGASGHSALRLPVVVATVPSIPLAALLARRCGATASGVAAAAWLVALSPLMLTFAQQARAYGPAATAALLAAVLLLRASDRGWDRRATIWAAVAVGLAPWAHYVALLPVAVVASASVIRAPRPAIKLLGTIVVPLWAAAAAFAVVQYSNVGAGMDGVTQLAGDDLRRVLATAWDSRSVPDATFLAVGAAASVLAAVLAVVDRGRARWVLFAGLAGPLAILAISAVGPDVVTTRYLVPSAPFLLVGLAVVASRWTAVPRVVVIAALVLISVTGVARTLDPATGDYANEERTIGYAVPQLRPGTVIASESFTLGTWLASYVGQRSGVPDVSAAWGQGQLIPVVCARRRVVQLVTTSNVEAAKEYWGFVQYRSRMLPTPEPTTVLVVATPFGPVPPACEAL